MKEDVQVSLKLPDAAATRALGARCAQIAQPGQVFSLQGRLGAGKTTFVTGLAEGLGSTADVGSPTFTLATEYSGGRLPLFHLDLYRLGERAQQEIDWLDEYLYSDGVCAVEWAEWLGSFVPATRVNIQLFDSTVGDVEAGRLAVVTLHGQATADWKVWLETWRF